MIPLILASGSAARRKLLTDAGFSFTVEVSDFLEVENLSKTPVENCADFALGKAKTVAKNHLEAIVIGVDTICLSPADGSLLGKPKSREEAKAMFQSYSGQKVEVITATAVVFGEKELVEIDRSDIFFTKISDEEIEELLDFHHKYHWKDCAGGLCIEAYAMRFINRIEGSYDSVLGLPVARLYRMIQMVL